MKKISTIIIFITTSLFVFCGCQNQAAKKNTQEKNNISVYTVKLTDVHGHRGDIILSGTTKAPNNSQIVVEQMNDSDTYFMNQARSSHIGKAKAALVKNNKFKAMVPASAMSSIVSKDLKVGDTFSLKIMAVSGHSGRIGVVKNNQLGKTIKKAKIKPTKFKLTRKMIF